MSVSYQSVVWSKHKKKYDRILWLFNVSFLLLAIGLQFVFYPTSNPATIIIRAFGLLSIFLLHVILLIGPLTRINTRLYPLLYNRRHLGVSMFICASVHAVYSLNWFHGGGDVSIFTSLFTSNLHYDSLRFFPFQVLGFFAYLILMVMAFTSHDFWLAALSPRVWKVLHMLVYVAYGLVLFHVFLGIIQFETDPFLFLFLFAGFLTVAITHIYTGWLSNKQLKENNDADEWVLVENHASIPDGRARMMQVGKESIAVFNNDGLYSAVHNVCKHQNGPLAEGKIVNGCITCPWHGYQYKTEDGCSPEPFTEKLATYLLKSENGKLYVNPKPLKEGTYVEPITISEEVVTDKDSFYIGWSEQLDASQLKAIKKFLTITVSTAVLFLFVFTNKQHRIANSAYLYGHQEQFTGVINSQPFPHMVYISGRDSYGNPNYAVVPLVNAFKFGAADIIQKFLKQHPAGQAQIKGTIINRYDDSTKTFLMELTSGEKAIQSVENSSIPTIKEIASGEVTIRGEIIDPKCYIGAMNPGQGKTHRSCAIRCISGGIMPMLVYRENGKEKYAVILGLNRESINQKVLPFVAEPVQITGQLYHYQNWDFICINPEKIIRLAN
jgi:nitrite reductase/ring-hydroxylating ferredoxin subunit/DMSO/TMAO reductase YedYZ heme-binding membrane subunit